MPIIDLQRRMRQLGEIRIGHVVDTGRVSKKTGKAIMRPEKLNKFRFTSPSRPLLEQVAELYGGTVQEWTPANGGPTEWEVYSDVDRVPVIIPPMANVLDAWYEQYRGSRCVRRCDGQREQKNDSACLCDPVNRECQITTRLNVMLKDVRGLGVWLLTTHSYYATTELPATVEMLARSGGEIAGWLTMEEKSVVRADGQTARFMLPKIDVDLSPGELFAGAGQAAVAAPGRAALGAGPARDFVADIEAAGSRDEVLALWRAAKDAGVPAGPVEAAAKTRVAELAALAEVADEAGEPDLPPDDPSVNDPTVIDAVVVDPEQVWQQLVQTAPPGWTITALEEAFAARYDGVHPTSATGAQMAEFAEAVTGGWVKPPANANGAPF